MQQATQSQLFEHAALQTQIAAEVGEQNGHVHGVLHQVGILGANTGQTEHRIAVAEHGVHHLFGDFRQRGDVDGFTRLELANELALQLAGLLVKAADLQLPPFTIGTGPASRLGAVGIKIGGDNGITLGAAQLTAGQIDAHREHPLAYQIGNLCHAGHHAHLGDLHPTCLAGDSNDIHAGFQLVDGNDGIGCLRLHEGFLTFIIMSIVRMGHTGEV